MPMPMPTADEPMIEGGGQMMMPSDDLDNPQNWPIIKKVYVSAVAISAAFVVLLFAGEELGRGDNGPERASADQQDHSDT
jgi:hypothetical protein